MSKQKKTGKRNWLNKHKTLVIWISSVFAVLLCICGGTVLYYRSLAKDYVRYLALQGQAIDSLDNKYDNLVDNSTIYKESFSPNDPVALVKCKNIDYPNKQFIKHVKSFKDLDMQNSILAYPYFKLTINKNSLNRNGQYFGYNQVQYYDKNKSLLKTITNNKTMYSYSPLDNYLQNKAKIINSHDINGNLYAQTIAGRTIINYTFVLNNPNMEQDYNGTPYNPYQRLIPGNLSDVNLSSKQKSLIEKYDLDTDFSQFSPYYFLPNVIKTKSGKYVYGGSNYNAVLNNLTNQYSIDDTPEKFIDSGDTLNEIKCISQFFDGNYFLKDVLEDIYDAKDNGNSNYSKYNSLSNVVDIKPVSSLYKTQNKYILESTQTLNISYNQFEQMLNALQYYARDDHEYYSKMKNIIKQYQRYLSCFTSSNQYLQFKLRNQIIYDKSSRYIICSVNYSSVNLLGTNTDQVLDQCQTTFMPMNSKNLHINLGKHKNMYSAVNMDKKYISCYKHMYTINKKLQLLKAYHPTKYNLLQYEANDLAINCSADEYDFSSNDLNNQYNKILKRFNKMF